MAKFIIQGGNRLEGKIRVAANKNAVLPIMAASILSKEEVVLENVPNIKDVKVLKSILVSLGALVKQEKRTLVINSKGINKNSIDKSLARKLRASILLLGPLLARAGSVKLYHPGGDIIGKRGIGTHLEGLRLLGVKTKIDDLLYSVNVENRKGGAVFLNEPSVTATENLMMFAASGEDEIIIKNAASEPHIVDLARFLEKLGTKISGAGTNRIKILGKRTLGTAHHTISPDFIEAGTFAITSALTGSNLEISPVKREDMRMIGLVFSRLGVEFRVKNDVLRVNAKKIKASDRDIKTAPWPGFPTDLMSPFLVLATQAKGQTLAHDHMYESRMFFADKLIQMGARIIICDPHRVIIYGPTQLYGRHLSSPDIRAGMALVIAALIAKGESVIDNAEIIERGYENLEDRLSQIGASIKKYE
jgi:UDP-N-acetylglucosamine 1-carboxyvinyltransferase